VRGGELFVEEALAENRHSELLVPMLRRLLDRAHLAPQQMDAFAFGQGPGSFTGIRIACGIVQGLAFAANRPVVPIPSLLALAEQSNESRVIAALDARMGEAYLAAYARNGEDWDEVIAPRLTTGNRCRRCRVVAGPRPAADSTDTRGFARPIGIRWRCASKATCRAQERSRGSPRGDSPAARGSPRPMRRPYT
jgi:tRNA threonylcarbamoyl adenosine modification protein YeaZ